MLLNCGVESPMDCKEIQLVHSKGDQPWDFFGRNETPVLWPPHEKSWLTGKDPDAGRDWGQEEKETTEDEMAGWHHGLDGRESEWPPGVGDGQGGLACCNSWGHQESNTTERLIWTEMSCLYNGGSYERENPCYCCFSTKELTEEAKKKSGSSSGKQCRDVFEVLCFVLNIYVKFAFCAMIIFTYFKIK